MASKNTKETAGSSRAGGRGKPKNQRTSGKRPVHREISAFVCLFIGFFLLLGMFGANGFFIKMLCDFAKGLLGTGFYVLPFAFLYAFWALLRHGGRPVVLRLLCIFCLPVAVGALAYLFTSTSFEWSSLGLLYKRGVNGGASGILSGFFGLLFSNIFSRIGAILLFIVLTLLALLGALNMTIFSFIRAVRNRPRLPKYEEPEEPPVDRAAQLVTHVQNRRIERVEKRRIAQTEQRRRASEFDVPVDDSPYVPVRPARSQSPDVFQVQSPVDYLLEQRRTAKEAQKPAPRPLENIGEVREQSPERLEVVPPEPAEVVSEPEPVLPPPIPFNPVEPEWQAAEPPAAAGPVSEQPVPVQPAPMPAAPAPKTDEPAVELVSREITEAAQPAEEYVFPPVELLRASQGSAVDGTTEMRENADRLNETLKSFNIAAHIVNVVRGPSVTRYELELDRGVKLSKLTNLSDDIALSLGASGVRISAIPDKISVVGIEVPNRLVTPVLVRDVIDSAEFRESRSRISFAVGKDIGGNRIVGDIAKLPHMLIAGTTGSGKSVCMNSLIISLLYKAGPDEVRLIMVDPKMVELGVYNGVPHLLIPVVTDPKKAAGALQWAVNEMLRRYRLMADAGVRDLESYNHQLKGGGEEQKPLEQIVVVIDELADLMLVAAKEVEESICRIAQMGRASGIHLVIATQRPSADVITGLMKANIPSRIAFAVASGIESRIILDTQGAEKLVGKGDMLYAPLGQGKPKRVQGCFITDAEVQEVVRFIKQSSSPNYSEEVQSQIEDTSSAKGDAAASERESEGCDELLPAAVDVFLETGQASVSMLQRRLKLGYARAARVVDEMEELGIVGPFEGSKPRQVLITREEWELRKQGGAAPAAPEAGEEV